jgi:hypothetical protein
MRSNKKEKKGNKLKGLLIVLIVFAIVGVFCWGNQQNEYVSSKKAIEKKANDTPEVVYYTIYPENSTCYEGLESLYFNLFSDDGNISIGCVPGSAAKNDKNLLSSGSFKVKLTGDGMSLASYTCNKSSSDANPNKVGFTIDGSKLTATPAADYKYKGTKCSKDKNYIVFDIDKLEASVATEADESAMTKDRDDKDLIEQEESYETTVTSEEDDPTEEADTDPEILNANKGYGWETVKTIGVLKSFKAWEEFFNKKPKSYRDNNTWTYEGKFDDARKPNKKDKNNKSKILNLYCNTKLTTSQILRIEKDNKNELVDKDGNITDYYYDDSNTKYYKATWTGLTKTTIKYKYHYLVHVRKGKNKSARTYKSVKQTLECKKTCTEYVKVEYGPPVQVNAGMCFEYRLKVSSITNCTAEPSKSVDKPKKPKESRTCVLKPTCGGHLRQAGPNEEYDSCVNKCDGGQYSQACSEKCYDEVYGSNNNNNNNSANNLAYSGLLTASSAEQIRFSDMSKATLPEKFVYNTETGEEVNIGNKCIAGQHYFDFKTPGKSGKGEYNWCTTHYKRTKVYIDNNKGITDTKSTKHAVRTGYIGIWYGYAKYKTKWINPHYSSDAKGRGYIRAQYDDGSQCGDFCYWAPTNSNCNKTDYYYYFNYNLSNYYANEGTTLTEKEKKCPKMWVFERAKGQSEKEGKYVLKDICETNDLKEADYKNNMHVYRSKLSGKCTGKTSCFQSTATYTIGFKYKRDTEAKVTRIDFPLTKSKDELHSEDETMPETNKSPEVIFRYGGCYVTYKKTNGKQNNWYLTEWTFPGTWLPFKGSSRKYGNVTDSKYYFVKGKVCVPGNLVNTNAAWAKNYINALEGIQNKGSEYVVDQSKWTFTAKDYSSDTTNGYNIKGTATNFGLFKWTFNISCFYALSNPDDIKKCPPDCSGQGPADIRSVDTEDPFLQNTTVSERIQYKKETRKVGFNWTSKATLGGFSTVTGGYNQDPQKLINKIRTTDTFNKSNLDYEFNIDVNLLRKLKKENQSTIEDKNGKIGGKIRYSNGVSHYKSNLLKSISSKNINECNNKTCHVIGGE